MNRVSLIARYLLGLLFTIIGLNGFFHFLPMPPPANPLALEYLTVLTASHYMVLIFLLQLIAGLLLLANRFVPLALTLLAGVLFNILLYHITMDPKGIGLGIFATILWLLTFPAHRVHFRPILNSKPQSAAF
jgi:putative oxidoreductase